jgi:hypothetical protein
MKYAIVFMIMFLVSVVNAAENCSESAQVETQDVVYEVNTELPKHLKGATITVTLADGKTSTVPAEKFMVVPRKQKTLVGQNQTLTKKLYCKVSGKKNIIMGEARKDVTEIETTTNGKSASVHSKKEVVPGLNYYRRELFDSPIGAGVGVDTNGTVKGMIGLDF